MWRKIKVSVYSKIAHFPKKMFFGLSDISYCDLSFKKTQWKKIDSMQSYKRKHFFERLSLIDSCQWAITKSTVSCLTDRHIWTIQKPSCSEKSMNWSGCQHKNFSEWGAHFEFISGEVSTLFAEIWREYCLIIKQNKVLENFYFLLLSKFTTTLVKRMCVLSYFKILFSCQKHTRQVIKISWHPF